MQYDVLLQTKPFQVDRNFNHQSNGYSQLAPGDGIQFHFYTNKL